MKIHGRSYISIILPMGLFLLGFLVRMVDLTDEPLDYHPTRQLFSALAARGMYFDQLESAEEWQREMAVRQWQGLEDLEPRIVERVVATTYRILGEEVLWVARVWSSLYWALGGLALYLLAKQMSGQLGAMSALAYYSFLPFGVFASRAFLPEPLMVAGLILAVLLVFRWFIQDEPSWRQSIILGVIAGASVYIKVFAIFPLVGAIGGLLLCSGDMKRYLREPKFWMWIAIMLVLGLMHYLYGTLVTGSISGEGREILSLDYIANLRFYLDWQDIITRLCGYFALVLMLLSLIGLRGKSRGLMLGLVLGYLLYGLTFPFHITTHSYYHLLLVPILALGVAAPVQLFAESLPKDNPSKERWVSVGLYLVLMLAIAIPIRTARGALVGSDYRSERGYYASIGEIVDHSSSVLDISRDYGYRLEYYGWVLASHWRKYEDPAALDAFFKDPVDSQLGKDLRGHRYLVVTMLSELKGIPPLETYLLETYPLYAEGEDYWVFDLNLD